MGLDDEEIDRILGLDDESLDRRDAERLQIMLCNAESVKAFGYLHWEKEVGPDRIIYHGVRPTDMQATLEMLCVPVEERPEMMLDLKVMIAEILPRLNSD